MCSEQSAGIILLLALALFVGSQVEIRPIDSSQTVCQRWYEPLGIGDDNRLKFNYHKECRHGRP